MKRKRTTAQTILDKKIKQLVSQATADGIKQAVAASEVAKAQANFHAFKITQLFPRLK